MSISVYVWKDTSQCTKNKLMHRATQDVGDALNAAKTIVDDVKERGDAALVDYALKFDGAAISQNSIKVTSDEFDAAECSLSEEVKDAIKHCAENVRKFHLQQMQRVEKNWRVEINSGVFAGEKVSPIPSVGLYVPSGGASYPSVTYMLSIPAVIAGVSDICIITPPKKDGKADAATLFTAKLCDIKNVYKSGGAGAIAALAYGTKTIPKVAKISGPGNSYVTAARQIVASVVDVGMPAGPTDSVIIADKSADIANTALDLLNEAEHGKTSASILITNDNDFANSLAIELEAAIEKLPQTQRDICRHVFSENGYGGIIVVPSIEEACDLANKYAPEHILIKTIDSEHTVASIVNAGEILIGEYCPFSMGNFGVGVNNVLPTGGWARTYSATTVWDFLKRTSISSVTRQGFDSLRDPVATIAKYEGFPAHTNAVIKRK